MNRSLQKLLAAMTLLLISAVSYAHTCGQNKPYGAIGNLYYNQLHGDNGPLGCALTVEANSNNGGRFVKFEHGEIAYSPRQGSNMTIAAWQAGDSVWLQWGQTDAHFDKFLVRYDYEHQNIGQDDWAPGTSGRYQLNASRPGNYGFSVQGCNGDCQGWDKTVEVYVDAADPRGVNGDLQVVTTGLLPSMERTVFQQESFFLDAFNRAWSPARSALCDYIKSQVGGADKIAPGYTLHPDTVCQLAPRGVLFIDDASGTTGAVDVTFDVPHNYFEATTTQPSVFGSYADPRFSFTYEIALHMRLDLINLQVQSVDYTVINASKPDSHNVAADVMNVVGPIVTPSVLRRVQAAMFQTESFKVDQLNAALQNARNAIAPNLPGHVPSFAVSNGEVLITLAQPLANTRQKVTGNTQATSRMNPEPTHYTVQGKKVVHAPVNARPQTNGH